MTFELPDDGAALKQLLQKFTYKPGWTFDVEREGLVIRFTAIDADDHTKLAPVSFGVTIPAFVRTDFPWDRWLLDQIMVVEDHEAREFFKINGVKVFDPHAQED